MLYQKNFFHVKTSKKKTLLTLHLDQYRNGIPLDMLERQKN